MYVCLCNGLTDRQVRSVSAVVGGAAGRVHRALGVEARCCKCIPFIREIIGQPEKTGSTEKSPG